jgi:hypothetical protein
MTSFVGFVLGDVMAQRIAGVLSHLYSRQAHFSSIADDCHLTQCVCLIYTIHMHKLLIRWWMVLAGKGGAPLALAMLSCGMPSTLHRGVLTCALSTAGVTVLDPFRCLRLGCYGLFVDGPFGHLWYKVRARSCVCI